VDFSVRVENVGFIRNGQGKMVEEIFTWAKVAG